MKRTLPLHLIWICVATGTYFIGTQRSAHTDATRSEPLETAAANKSGSLLSPSKKSASTTEEAEQEPAAVLSGTAWSPAQLTELSKAATSSNPVERAKAMAQLLESLSSENASQILGAMHEAGANDEQMGSLVYAWAATDGPAAMAFADEMAEHMSEKDRVGFQSQVAKGWGSTDPEAAIAWVDSQQDQRAAGYHRWNLVSGIADGNLDAATAYVLSRGELEDRGAPKYMGIVTERVLDTKSVTEAAAWADALPEGGTKTAALRRVATDFVEENPEGAAAWATALADSEHGPRVINEVSDEWAERDPDAAVAWLETLPDGDAKEAGMSAALTEWVKRGDPVAASEYLAAMPASDQRDHAVGGFASTLAHSDPASAVTWAETIQDEGIRQEALHEAGRAWLRNDPTAASDWLQSSSLSEEAIQRISAPRGEK